MTVFQAYCWIAGLLIILLILVAQKASHDKACSEDAWYLRWARRGSLYLGALALLYSIGNRMTPASMLIVVGSAAGILAVNLLVLHLRPKPPIAHSVEASTPQQVYDIAARARARRSF